MPSPLFSPSPLSPRTLAEILRTPAKWPEGFQWDYGTHETCAIGLTAKLVNQPIGSSRDFANRLGLPASVGREIGCYARDYYGLPDWASVSPEQIAELLEHWDAHGSLPAKRPYQAPAASKAEPPAENPL